MRELEPAPTREAIAVDGKGMPLLLFGRWALWFPKLYDFLVSPSFSRLPEYADNVAALAGGLAAGDVYRTATGELRIVV